MKRKINRRNFIQQSSKAGFAGCALMIGGINTVKAMQFLISEDIPKPGDLCYCGYQCPADCKFKVASVENNDSLKKLAYTEWKIKERHGIDFDPDKIFCFGCKTKDKPEGIVLNECTVRKCVIERNMECCIECKELKNCEKELWGRFPEFKKYVIDLQSKFFAANNKG